MTSNRIDANLLVALHAILIEANLTRAGERLGRTQPAMSGALARLRRQFDDPLLVRVGRSYELTPLASRLLPTVEAAVEATVRTLQVRSAFDPVSSHRTFAIAASDYAMSIVAAPLRALARAEAPGVALDFVPLPTESVDVFDLLRLDVVIASDDRGLPGRRMPIFADEFVLIADRHHPDLRAGGMDLAAIARAPFAMSAFGDGITTPADDALAEQGISPRVAVTAPGFVSLPLLIRASELLAIVPARVATTIGSQLGLVVVDSPLVMPTLVETAHWHPNAAADPALQWLLGRLTRLRIY